MKHTLTDAQLIERIQLADQHLSHREIAEMLGVNRSNITRSLNSQRALELKAAHEDASPGYHISQRTGLYKIRPDGEEIKTLEWRQERPDKQSLEQLREAFMASLGEIKPLPKIPQPKISLKDILVCYPAGDPHIGMYAFYKETGENFDCEIAEEDLLSATDYLVSVTPPSERALIINLGDFFHSDNLAGVTNRSGANLDVDTRWPRVLQIGIAIMRRMIERALQKHKHVTVINAIGNHDDQSSIMLSVALRLLFEKNKRVEVLETNNAFHYFEFGKCLIGVHHGHSVKKERLPGLMAADKPEEWGRTKFRYWLTGHVHHKTITEIDAVIIESFRTLASKDAWHTNSGYRAGRDMNAIVYHKDYGETDRHRCDILRARK